ncbi:3beta-hydroxy-Delta5-steroid dehydrogenase / steroid Delta-isomerase [Mytilus galloprovincialis]|uniref:3beta-hydroxy-Delta5-steroid dehydrogenase / steroid Delta-isomerase n=1 Tax=Mytilus galloprovincialis TaxID=29158 RepID=A0A8B6F3H5_MYTGA|nr:3beta-hydroxy-Delta5-steroid dehydrogenase / steroid Delta-isomerase [Mytilus galloprovincialis]
MGSLVVLVTGGSGFLGQHVVKHLQLYGDCVKEIRILDCLPFKKKLDYADSKPVTSFTGNITDEEIVSKSCNGVDAVLHIASIIDTTMFPNKERLYEVNVKGTQTMLAACKKYNIGIFIYCSSIAVLQGFEDVQAGTETTVSVPSTLMFPSYGSTKYLAQNTVLNDNGFQFKNGEKMKTLAILPLTMYGELDSNLTPLMKSIKNKTFPRIGPMKAYAQFAYVGNVAMMFVKALESLKKNPDLGGQYFFGADDTPANPMTGFLQPFLGCLNSKISSWYLPYWLMYICLTFLYVILLVLRPIKKLNVPMTTKSLAFNNTTFYVTYDKAKTLLGYKPLYDYENSLENAIKFYSNV